MTFHNSFHLEGVANNVKLKRAENSYRSLPKLPYRKLPNLRAALAPQYP